MNTSILRGLSMAALAVGLTSNASAQQPEAASPVDRAQSPSTVAGGEIPAQQSPSSVEGTAAPAVASPVADESGIKDIIVTAERRQGSVQHTPISISAFSGDELVRRSLNSVDDVLRQVPAVLLQGNANGAYVYIRGVGSQQDTAIGGPAVNLNFDGVYQQQTDAPFSSLYDLERIEVLRGPQGTLYGRNATAGSINIITASPTFDAFHAKGNILYGNYGAVKGEAALNIPITDTLAVRTAGTINRHRGYLHPSGYDDADNAGARVKALWEPTQGVKLLLATDYLHIGGVGPGTVDPLSTHLDDPWRSTAVTGKIDITYRRYYGQLDADLGFGTLTVLPAYQRYTKFDNNVLINYPTAATTSSAGQVNETQRTLEARIASNSSSRINWLVGMYYLNSTGSNPFVTSQIALPQNAQTFPYLAGSKTRSLAGFGQVTVPLTEQFRVTGGVRYTHDFKSLTDQTSATSALHPETSFNSFTYKAGVEYDVAPRILTYANISTGFKAGGLDQGFRPYKPEHLRAIQAGIKSRFLDNRVQINAEGFHYDYKNFQAQYGYRCQNTALCSPVIGFANTIVNAGSATLYGGELEAVVQPWRNGRLTGSATYTHSVFDRLVISPGTATQPATCVPALTCPLLADQILTDQPLANAPKWTYSFGYAQDVPLDNGARITFSGDLHHYSGYWTLYRRPPQVPLESYQNPYLKANLNLTYNAAGDRWSVGAFVKNVGNKVVVTSAIANSLTIAPPRTYGVQMSAQF